MSKYRVSLVLEATNATDAMTKILYSEEPDRLQGVVESVEVENWDDIVAPTSGVRLQEQADAPYMVN